MGVRIVTSYSRSATVCAACVTHETRLLSLQLLTLQVCNCTVHAESMCVTHSCEALWLLLDSAVQYRFWMSPMSSTMSLAAASRYTLLRSCKEIARVCTGCVAHMIHLLTSTAVSFRSIRKLTLAKVRHYILRVHLLV
jgi:hypothetical protein